MKIGFVSMPLSGHLNPMTALARRLQSRGNEVVFFGVPDVEPFARAAGLDFVPYGEAEYPVGSIDRVYSSVATMRGFEVVRHSCMDLNPDLTRVAFDYLAEKLTTTGVEALVIDTVHFFHRACSSKHVYALCTHLKCSSPRFLRSNSTLSFQLPA